MTSKKISKILISNTMSGSFQDGKHGVKQIESKYFKTEAYLRSEAGVRTIKDFFLSKVKNKKELGLLRFARNDKQ